MMMKNANKFLLLGGALSGIAASLHIAIIIGGAQWYRFFGAGEELATLAESGSRYPAIITSGIAAILFIWALYAFSGAGLIRRLPLLKTGLVVISAVYLVRGLVFIPVLIWSSLVCLVYGFSYAAGTRQVWARL
jgi:hypothetical protein